MWPGYEDCWRSQGRLVEISCLRRNDIVLGQVERFKIRSTYSHFRERERDWVGERERRGERMRERGKTERKE